MDFELTDDQQMLGQTVRRFFADRAPLSWVRERMAAGGGVTPEVWSAVADLGVLSVVADGSMIDAGVVCEEAGRACFPGPLDVSMVGAVSASVLSGRDRWLAGLVDGSVIGTVAFTDELGSTLERVPHGMAADVLFVAAGAELVAVDLGADGVERSPVETVDGTRPVASVSWPSAAAETIADDQTLIDQLRDRMVVAAAIDGLGAAQRALDMAVAYAGERHQFGKPIGSFQAVQHLCADMLIDVEIGRAACYYALWACDAAPAAERRRAAAMAKAWASDAFPRVGATCIQVHGGIGFTWEHDAHLPYKRLLTLSQWLGSSTDHLLDLADQVLRP